MDMEDTDYMGNIDLQAVINYALSEFVLEDSSHGLPHWRRVERNGLRLAKGDEEVNKRVVRLFAYLHDHKRNDNGYDIEHGQRSADALKKIRDTLLKDLTDEEFDQLYTACALHTKVQSVDDSTVNICFDADRIDLTRCGIIPEADRMASEAGYWYVTERWG